MRSVPRTVVNRSGAFVGALPEHDFIAATLQLAGVPIDEPVGEGIGESTELSG